MARVIGVQFQKNGKVYYFQPGAFEPHTGEYVIVDTERGADLAEAVTDCFEFEPKPGDPSLKNVVRMATEADLVCAEGNREKEKEAFAVGQRKIQEHKLEMKLVSVEYAFDGSKILFYFTANGRVDFRSLVKDLASVFKTRIELRQIGVRDEARMLGGLGPCGRPICCKAFLNDFQPVSIKMAKEQNLSLNPTKISGVCGRLMCCLKYEQDQYEQIRKKMPKVGREVQTPDGIGTVTELNVVKETVSVRIMNGDNGEIKIFPMTDVFRPGMEPKPVPMDDTGMDPQTPAEEKTAVPTEESRNADVKSEEKGQRTPKPVRRNAGSEDRPEQTERTEKQERKLGQPVRRENPRKSGGETAESRKERNEKKFAGERNEKNNGGLTPIPSERIGEPGERKAQRREKVAEQTSGKKTAQESARVTGKNWADQLQKAMAAIEGPKEQE